MKKKTFDLICSVGELTGIFHKKTNINGLLHIVVKLVAKHMETEACSIFLLDNTTGNLVLRASVGLNPDMIGILSLTPGEGITGTSLKESRAINVPRGSNDPHFKYIEGIFEERYESFLAVPILHSKHRLGVIVLEDSRPDYYTERDQRALGTIASQLAAFLENAKLLLELRNQKNRGPEEAKDEKDNRRLPLKDFYRGEAASGGIALGRAVLVSGSGGDLLLSAGHEAYRQGESAFEEALEKTKRQLELLQQHMEDALSEVGSLIFGSHLLMLSDEDFSGSMRKNVREGMTPQQAVVKVVNEYVMLFINSRNQNVQEKVHDVKDLGHRLLKNLLVNETEDGDYSGQIVVAQNLLPSELVKLGVQNTEGFVLFGAGMTSHISILSRSLEVPVILLGDKNFFQFVENRLLILDAYQGTIMVDPAEEVIDRYLETDRRETDRRNEDYAEPFEPIALPNGRNVELLANINILSDVHSAKRSGAKGVGLYRSEFLYLIRNSFPTEEEQVVIYEKLLNQIDNVVFRTFDLGGDKILRSASSSNEKNPFMGLRSLRYAMKNRDLFKIQLRSILRAGKGKTIKILFPLVAGPEDFLEAREVVYEAAGALEAEGIEHNANPQIGAMIELPSSALLVEEIAEHADFLSIGTNDLVQYVLGVDRTNQQIAHLYDQQHPAVLRLLKMIAEGAERKGCPVSVCGNSATDPQMLHFFIKSGIYSFSVDPRSFSDVRAVLQEIADEMIE
ncbi:phosphoenolpyruvate--protein phosphotransferase [Sediminispirochaeta smaragdinae]|uniref:Phosphoenolpyruvate-protein phosphotransferase n=1 Tax=Sediminispirochaeta smaragdinae (strain DSM 11293 / JCM 15392 / SEBR 4228) TaxID=573413 RepID=E1R4B1_SEDSS|nr:phosphoenolpyruvate--protein phosphotransferase [Sediminispirochaeta smaragdinae]ADK81652.1 PTSINtr with GAF domain, PtsP [Sediminispirochaeta smaragdinae DSM 11293]